VLCKAVKKVTLPGKSTEKKRLVTDTTRGYQTKDRSATQICAFPMRHQKEENKQAKAKT
jgi:hypothetical protein